MKHILIAFSWCFIASYYKSSGYTEISNSTAVEKASGNFSVLNTIVYTSKEVDKSKPFTTALTSFYNRGPKNVVTKHKKKKHRKRKNKRKYNSKKQRKASKNGNKKKLGIVDDRTNAKTNKTSDVVIPPDFMVYLQRAFSVDNNYFNRKLISHGDTIRTFFPLLDYHFRTKQALSKYNGTRNSTPTDSNKISNHLTGVYLFNLSSIPNSESVIKAELRIKNLKEIDRNLRRSIMPSTSSRTNALVAVYRESNLNSDIRTKVYQKTGPPFSIKARGFKKWSNSKLTRLVNSVRSQQKLIVVKFYSVNNDEHFDMLFPQVLRLDSKNQHKSLVNQTNAKSKIFANRKSDSLPIFTVYCNETKLSSSASDNKLTHKFWVNLQNLTSTTKLKRPRRLARQKLLNRPSVSSSNPKINELPGNEKRSSIIPRSTSFSYLTGNGQTELLSQRMSDRNLMNTLKDRKSILRKRKLRKRRSRKCRKRKRKGKKGRRCKPRHPVKATPEPNLNRATSVCSRKSLRVDFSEIGWGDWIISPKHYDAYYCSGTCKFDTIKAVSASNHAIIQSFINEFEINPEVPEPCCVPETLSSMTVLYFDQNESVVLKVYPHMSVEKCACR